MTKLLKILVFTALLSLTSCIFVKSPKPVIESVVLSPKPTIAMENDDFLRSNSGDLAAFIPKDWFFVDVEEDISSDVLGVAVNPDYSLCAVFSKIKQNDKSEEAVANEGLIGLANAAIARHALKTGNAAKLIGKPSIIEIGANKFAYFEISTNAGATKTISATFISSINNYYQVSLTPLDIAGKPDYSKKEMKDIFNSILCSLQF